MKKFISLILVFIFAFSLSSCSKMPFNGEIEFHSISLTIPERFIRDSTQSNDDLWIFERNNYSEYIIISRKDVTGDAKTALDDYVAYMKENSAESEIISFLNNDAVFSTYEKDGVFCQEILFAYNSSFYSVALRGGTQNDFTEITDTIRLSDIANEVAA